MTAEAPVLWHLKVSHYNEEARWALDHKQIAHTRRPVVPGQHRRIAARLTGGTTFPVLQLDGRAIGDSTHIIAALEQLQPEPPLYPADPGARRRALALEEEFDEHLGPDTRLLVVHHTLAEPKLFLGTFAPDLRGARRLAALTLFGRLRSQIVADFGIDDERVARAYDALAGAGARFRAEVGPGGYLVGDRFTVADLTLAALLAPIVAPEQFPYPQPQRDHPRLARAREILSECGLLAWTRDIYRRHRGRSAALTGGTT